jgi:hypothetical protein
MCPIFLRGDIMKKAGNFLLKLTVTMLIAVLVIFILFFLNRQFKVVDLPINEIQTELKEVNSVLFVQLVTGISVGTALLLIFIFILPLFTKKINTKEYLKNIILGVIASFVFYVSQTIYHYFERFGKFYMAVSVAATVVVTFIIVEIMSLTFQSERKEIEFRTAILGCIASGLIFSVVLNIVLMVMDYFKIIIKF